jgi:transposase
VPSAASPSRSKKVLHAAERDETVRAAWWQETQTFDPTDLVFVDESGTNLGMAPRYGRAPRGQRVVGTVPRNQGTNTTLFAAMDLTGITAAMTLEGAADGVAFEVFVARILAPVLRPGQIVVWDNLSVHKRAAAQRLIEARGCRVHFLPPYSPDFSPIELAFSKLKTYLRRVRARTRAALEEAITAGLRTITAADACAWFVHCGYTASPQLF